SRCPPEVRAESQEQCHRRAQTDAPAHPERGHPEQTHRHRAERDRYRHLVDVRPERGDERHQQHSGYWWPDAITVAAWIRAAAGHSLIVVGGKFQIVRGVLDVEPPM